MKDWETEPTDSVEAIVWNMVKIDYHDVQATLADGMDMTEAVNYHEALSLKHSDRLKEMSLTISASDFEKAHVLYNEQIDFLDIEC